MNRAFSRTWFWLVLGAAILVVASPDVGHAASPLAVDDGSIDPWIIACAACVGFALGAGVFAITAFLAFIVSPAGQQLVYACAGACASAIMVE